MIYQQSITFSVVGGANVTEVSTAQRDFEPHRGAIKIVKAFLSAYALDDTTGAALDLYEASAEIQPESGNYSGSAIYERLATVPKQDPLSVPKNTMVDLNMIIRSPDYFSIIIHGTTAAPAVGDDVSLTGVLTLLYEIIED